jgi:glycosyltransferase involved in cell wall biosynthesis
LTGWIEMREARMLAVEEARLAARASTTLLISSEEAALFRSRLPGELRSADVRVLGNGIDSIAFDPAVVAPEPRMLDCPGPRLIFTGQMDYRPNIDAVHRAIDGILPSIRAVYPQATFHVVGRNPEPPLLARHGQNGCHVWGRVEDIRPWLAAADCALVPLDIGRGVQNKVLEAMAMALPVVLTDEAATGIAASDREHFAVAGSDEALARNVIDLLGDSRRMQAMGQAARSFVVERVSWEAALAPLAELVEGPGGPARHAA